MPDGDTHIEDAKARIAEKIAAGEEDVEATTTEKAPRERKAKSGGLPNCPVTGQPNKPGSRFRPGMDARLKGMIARVKDDRAEPGFAFPPLVIEYAKTMPEQMRVGDYDAAFILEMHEKLEKGGGIKQPKETKEKEPAAAK